MADGYYKFYLANRTGKQAEEAREFAAEQERLAEERENRVSNTEKKLAQSVTVDVSKIAVEELSDKTEEIVLWAIGRYLMQEVSDFTKEGKMELLKKYLDIANPSRNEGAYGNRAFPMIVKDGYDYCLPYGDFLMQLNIKDEELKQFLDIHPCDDPRVFIKHPSAYSKDNAKSVVRCTVRPIPEFNQTFADVKEVYIDNFGSDFDEIPTYTDKQGNQRCVLDSVQDAFKKLYNLKSAATYAPEYIEKFLPDLMEQYSYQTLKECIVNEQTESTLGRILDDKHKQKLDTLQLDVDTFFAKQGNINYIVFDLPVDRHRDIDWCQAKKTHPDFLKLYFCKELIYINDIGNKSETQFLLLNLKRIKESPEKRLTLYVPAELIGRVIGKGGSNIKKLEEATGKKFQVLAGDFRIAQKTQNAKDRIAGHQAKTQTDHPQGNNSPKFSGPKGPNGNDGR